MEQQDICDPTFDISTQQMKTHVPPVSVTRPVSSGSYLFIGGVRTLHLRPHVPCLQYHRAIHGKGGPLPNHAGSSKRWGRWPVFTHSQSKHNAQPIPTQFANAEQPEPLVFLCLPVCLLSSLTEARNSTCPSVSPPIPRPSNKLTIPHPHHLGTFPARSYRARLPLHTLFKSPSLCASLFRLSSPSPIALTKPHSA